MRRNHLHEAGLGHPVGQQTDLASFQQAGGRSSVAGEGVCIFDSKGRDDIEAMAGLRCASLGFFERRLAEAAWRQMLRLTFHHTFVGKGHEPSVRLAEKLAQIAPHGLRHVLFPCSGWEANGAAIKLIWRHAKIRGRPQKTR